MKLWEGLNQDSNFNAMVFQRGVLNLDHSDGLPRVASCPKVAFVGHIRSSLSIFASCWRAAIERQDGNYTCDEPAGPGWTYLPNLHR